MLTGATNLLVAIGVTPESGGSAAHIRRASLLIPPRWASEGRPAGPDGMASSLIPTGMAPVERGLCGSHTHDKYAISLILTPLRGRSAGPSRATNLPGFIAGAPLEGISAGPIGMTKLLISNGMTPSGGGSADPIGATYLIISAGRAPLVGRSPEFPGKTKSPVCVVMAPFEGPPWTPSGRLNCKLSSRWHYWEGARRATQG